MLIIFLISKLVVSWTSNLEDGCMRDSWTRVRCRIQMDSGKKGADVSCRALRVEDLIPGSTDVGPKS